VYVVALWLRSVCQEVSHDLASGLTPRVEQYRHQIAEEWKQYWKERHEIPEWDFMSQIVYEGIKRNIPEAQTLEICEVGCGTGRISLRLAQQGGIVSAIDIVPEAVAMTKTLFAQNKQSIDAREGSIFSIPFSEGKFDVTWNAGVLEHFSAEERLEALTEMTRITKPNGMIVTLNPYSRSMLYRLGKLFAELFDRWPYGHEDPIRSLRPSKPDCLVLKREYTTGFFVVLLEVFRAIPTFAALTFKLRKAFVRLYDGRLGWLLRIADKLLSTLTGGYLLVSVFQKRKE
jgi:2-polyprenyl-3-methyl-5-hydroxy-6-metoxy-1,4-benzoquinol methylase